MNQVGVFKKGSRQLKICFMYKTYCSPYFQSIRIDSLLGDDPIFMAISVCSVYEALHIFSHRSKHHPYISFGLGVFLMETCFTL